MSVQRYSIEADWGFTQQYPRPDGEWVRWADACDWVGEAQASEYLVGYEAAKNKYGIAAAPRVLTADDPEPAVGSVVLDADGDAWQHIADQDYAGDCWINVHIGFTSKWATFGRPVTLIHDGGG